MEERRRSRKVITNLDQELLNHVRAVFKAGAGEAQLLTREKLAAMLGIKDETLSRRIFSMFDGTGRDMIEESAFQKAVISLVLGEEEAKLRFVFDLHDSDGDGGISRDDLSRMLDASLHNNAVSMTEGQRRDMAELLFQAADRRHDNSIDFAELKMLLARYPLIRNDLIKSVAAWFWKERNGTPRTRAITGFHPAVSRPRAAFGPLPEPSVVVVRPR